MFVQQMHNIYFLQHCYMFRRLYIIVRESLIMYVKVSNPYSQLSSLHTLTEDARQTG